MTKALPGTEGPVTVTIARRVKPGLEKEYERWIEGITEVAQTFPGHMGVSTLPPSDVTDGDYVIIFRYDTYENLCAWEESEERAEWLKKLEGLVEGEARIQRVTGLEFLFPLAEVPGGDATAITAQDGHRADRRRVLSGDRDQHAFRSLAGAASPFPAHLRSGHAASPADDLCGDAARHRIAETLALRYP